MADWEVRVHAANPKMATVFGPQMKASPECEGGRWYTDPETANLIAAAPALLEALTWLMLAPRKSVDKDNMEFDVRATCFAIDKATAAIAMARGMERP